MSYILDKAALTKEPDPASMAKLKSTFQSPAAQTYSGQNMPRDQAEAAIATSVKKAVQDQSYKLSNTGTAPLSAASIENAKKYVSSGVSINGGPIPDTSSMLKTASVIGNQIVSLQGVGAAPAYAEQLREASRSVSERMSDPGKGNLRVFPGGVYVAHLAKRMKRVRDGRDKKGGTEDINIYTDHMQALKTALGALGIYSERNPGGMPIDIKAAKKIWFGSEEVDGMQETEWRSLVEMGDQNIDPKRIRKFVNYDGSITWEMLNEDKTVMSRFTMGEHKGTKVFTQGGYAKFTETLKEAKAKLGPDEAKEFSSLSGKLVGGF